MCELDASPSLCSFSDIDCGQRWFWVMLHYGFTSSSSFKASAVSARPREYSDKCGDPCPSMMMLTPPKLLNLYRKCAVAGIGPVYEPDPQQLLSEVLCV